MKTNRQLTLIAVAAVLLATSGCINIFHKPMDLKAYMITAPRDLQPLEKPMAAKLWISPVSVLPPFNVRNLVLRDSDVRFETTYYSELLLSPSENFRNAFFTWFSDSGIFQDVSISDYNKCTHQLSLTVTEFYGSREAGNPKTVLKIKATLFDEHARNMRVIFSKDYVQEEPVPDMGSDQLIRSYNTSLALILADCEADVIGALSQ